MTVFYRVSLFCRVFFLSLPSVFFSTRQIVCLPSDIILPSVFFAALGKELVCRVPDRMHSTNMFAIGTSAVSGSDMYTSMLVDDVNCMLVVCIDVDNFGHIAILLGFSF